MGGLGRIDVRAAGRSAGAGCPGLAVSTDHPALACLGVAVRGLEARARRLLRDGQRPGPRAGPRRGSLRRARRRRASADARCCAWRRATRPPAEIADDVAERGGVDAGRPHVPVRADREPRRRRADRRARGRDRAAQAARARVRRPAACVSGFGTLPAAAGRAQGPGRDRPHQRRRALRRPVELHRRRRRTTSSPSSSPRLPSSASDDFGEPFGKLLEAADWDFYDIDPLLFSPAEMRLVNAQSGRSFQAGGRRRSTSSQRSFRG